MYTTYGTGFGKFSQTYHIGTRKYGHKPGYQEQEEKKTPSSRKPHGFLNTRIPSPSLPICMWRMTGMQR